MKKSIFLLLLLIPSIVCAKTLQISTPLSITISEEIPSPINTQVIDGGSFTISAGQVLTINVVQAGRYQIFSGTGTVVGLEEAFPEWWTDNTTPGTTDMESALNSAFAASDVVIGSGTYAASDTVQIGDGQTLTGNMTVKSITGMDSKPIITIKEGDGTNPAWGTVIDTGVVLDGNDIAQTGVYVYYGRDVTIQPTKITRVNKYGVYAGDSGAAAPSTGCHVINANIWYHESGDPVSKGGSYANPSDSVGVYHNNCTDSRVINVTSSGFRYGFYTSSSGGNTQYIACHAWSRRSMGPMVAAFYSLGSSGNFTDCNADTPHNWYSADGSTYTQDGAITNVYGFYINSYSQAIVNSKVYLNPAELYGGTDDLVTAVHFAKAEYGYIFGLQIQGGSASFRYKNIYGGTTTNVTILGTGIPSASTLVNTATAFDQIGLRQIHITSDNIAIDDAAATSRLAYIMTAGSKRWDFGGDAEAESGTNAGTNFRIRSYDDTGASLHDPLSITRSNGYLKLGNVPTYENNASASAAGLTTGQVYRTSAGILMITY